MSGADPAPHPPAVPEPGGIRLSVVVPAYREEAVIGATVASLRAGLGAALAPDRIEILVVDDGSDDATAERARAAGADRVIGEPHRGKGAAVRTGMLAARGRTVAFCDADLAYSPEQILRLLARVEGGWDVAVGSRHHIDTVTLVRARRSREVTGRAFASLTGAVVLGRRHDTQCGVKAFGRRPAQEIFGRSRIDGFAFDVEIFVLAERLGLSLTEVPVALSNSARSTVSVGRDTLRMVRDLARVRWWAARGAYGPR